MRTSELIRPGRYVRRKVGIHVPSERSAVDLAIRLLDEGLDMEIAGRTLWIEVGRLFALPVMQAIERMSGIPAFNEWEQTPAG